MKMIEKRDPIFDLHLIMIDSILDFLYPPLCVSCDEPGEYLCIWCKKDLKPHPEICPICHKGSPDYTLCMKCSSEDEYPLAGILIWFEYMESIKRLLLALKFGHKSHVAWFLAERMSLLIQSHPQLAQAIRKQTLVITYVPSHWIRKYRVKGYNQSELLAKELGNLFDLPVRELTRRVRYTRSQVSLSRSRRLRNLIWAFGDSTDEQLDDDEIVLIVDDITTTWSTLIHVAKQIKEKYSTVEVWGAVVGRNN